MLLNSFARFFGAASVAPRQTQMLINGQFVNSADGRTFETINPATEEIITNVQQAGVEDVNRAVAAAREAFDNGPWRRMLPRERGQLLYKLADLIEQNTDELAELESLDNGKALAFSKGFDLDITVKGYRYMAGWADKLAGQVLPSYGPYFSYMRKEPVGVVGAIVAWNFPIMLMNWKLAPALAAGCTVVFKPAEQTPLTALRVGELIMEAGFPEGVVNILPGFGDTGSALCKHPGVDKIAFTGSTEVGLEIMRTSHEHRLKKITLELGGKSPHIILKDANIDRSIDNVKLGMFFNQGQVCCAGTRVFVDEEIHDEFVDRAVKMSEEVQVGDPFDANTFQGAQIDQKQMDKILGYIEAGKNEGAELLTGGARHGDKGYFVEPTVFGNVNDDMSIAKEEIFGPVMSVLKFKDMDELIRRANETNYGLAAGVQTTNIDNAYRLANELRAGTVWVNCYNLLTEQTNFGGFKDSGFGKDSGALAINNYTDDKLVIIAQNDDKIIP